VAAVKDRLTKEITYWDHRAEQLKEQELSGRTNARLNSGIARRRADDLSARLEHRMKELAQERQLSPLPPVVMAAALIVPGGLLAKLKGIGSQPETFARETARIEAIAIEAIMLEERRLGFIPQDVSAEKRGYDIESEVPGTGRLRFIEVKGRAAGAETVTITKNEILTGLNKPDDFILALVEVDGTNSVTHYIQRPFNREPDFAVTSLNFNIEKLLRMGQRAE
jgi:hypothetical protein